MSLDGAEARTIEEFEDDLVMASMRKAFHEEHALQCGFCTSGMLITARDIVMRFPMADEKRIRAALSGNLCRCTGYVGIVNAIQRVMIELPGEVRVRSPSAHLAWTAMEAPFRPFDPRDEATVAVQPTAPIWETAAQEPGWSRITDHFRVELPATEVWRLLADVSLMAQCMPGAELTEQNGADLKGRVRVAFGPIRASFAGAATLRRDDTKSEGRLEGRGDDERGGSRAKGRVAYRLVEEDDGAATRVQLALDYQLQGPLAQFARLGLVKQFVSGLIAEFAANLSAKLGKTPRGAQPKTSAVRVDALLWSLFKKWLRRWTGKMST